MLRLALAALLLPATACATTVFTPLANLNLSNGPYVYGGAAVTPTGAVVFPMAYLGSSVAGTVVALTKPATGTTWTSTTIATFPVSTYSLPTGSLTADAAGNLYGAAGAGGSTAGACAKVAGLAGCGAIYRLTPKTGGGYTFSTITTFAGGTDGAAPTGDLTMDSAGNLYGATAYGGAGTCTTCGTIFKLTLGTGGTFTRTVLTRFAGGTDGKQPGGYLAVDASGNVYGTTIGGGQNKCQLQSGITPDGGCGTVFSITAAGVRTILYSFADGADGSLPAPGLARGKDGSLYGATGSGGNTSFNCANHFNRSGCGLVFKLKPATGGTYTRSTVWVFSGTDGATPATPLIDSKGNLYVTAANTLGGASTCQTLYCGTVVKLIKPVLGSTTWTRNVLHSFLGTADNAGPLYRLAGTASGTLYGVSEYLNTSGAFSISGAGYLPP